MFPELDMLTTHAFHLRWCNNAPSTDQENCSRLRGCFHTYVTEDMGTMGVDIKTMPTIDNVFQKFLDRHFRSFNNSLLYGAVSDLVRIANRKRWVSCDDDICRCER
jgi:hypothetical protein